MDNIINKIETLSRVAALRHDPRPLDVSGIMTGIRGLEIVDEYPTIPLGFLTGGAAAAAAAAVVVSVLAVLGWSDFSTPLPSVDALMDMSDFIL